MAKEDNLTPFTSDNAAEMGAKGGRAKAGSKHISTHIQEMLTDPDFELKLKDGSVLKGAPLVAIIKTAIAKGISGQVQWAEWLAKHGYGLKVELDVIDRRKEILLKYGLGEPEDVGETKET